MVEAVRLALAEVGEVSHEELAAHVQKAFGISIRPNFVPIVRAAVKDKENLEAWRRRAEESRTISGPGRQGPGPETRPL
jgi:hypothetical protein